MHRACLAEARELELSVDICSLITRSAGVAGIARHPPLAGEVSRAERVTEGCHPHDGGTPLRLAFGQPPPLPGEDEGFAAAVGRIQTFSPRGKESSPAPRTALTTMGYVVMPGLTRHPAHLSERNSGAPAHDRSDDHKTSLKPSASASRHRLPAMLRASPRSSHYRPGGRPAPARPSSSIWGRRMAGPPHNRRRACHNIARPPGSATS